MSLAPLSVVLFLSACATQRPQIMQTVERSEPGTTVPRSEMDAVRYGETVKAYPIGRYIDPNSRGIMHEGHTVYRVENAGRWNLQPNAPTRVPMGPAVAQRDPSLSPAPVNDEIRAEINRQKTISREMTLQSERLNEYLQSLRGSVEESKAIAEQNLTLKKQLAETQARIGRLEEQLANQPKSAPTPAQQTAKRDGDAW